MATAFDKEKRQTPPQYRLTCLVYPSYIIRYKPHDLFLDSMLPFHRAFRLQANDSGLECMSMILVLHAYHFFGQNIDISTGSIISSKSPT